MKLNHKKLFIYLTLSFHFIFNYPVYAGVIENLLVKYNNIIIYLNDIDKIRLTNNNTNEVTLIFDNSTIESIYKYNFDQITKDVAKSNSFITDIQMVQYSLDPPETRLIIRGSVNFNVKLEADNSNKIITLSLKTLELPKLIPSSETNNNAQYPKQPISKSFESEEILKLISERNLESAKKILTSSILEDTNNLWAKYYLSKIYIIENKLQEAYDLNMEITKFSPDFFDSYFTIGIIKDKEAKTDEAINYYLKALKVNPEHQECRFRLAINYLLKEQFEKSIEELEKLLALNPNYSPALDNIGLVYLKLSDIEQAEKYFRQSIRTDSINNLANIFIEKKQTDMAMKLFILADEISPNNPIVLYNLAKVYQLKDDKEKAIEYYKKAIQYNNNMYNAHYNLGLIYAAQGDDNKAIKHLTEYLNLNPTAEDYQAVKNTIKKLQEF